MAEICNAHEWSVAALADSPKNLKALEQRFLNALSPSQKWTLPESLKSG